jgi:hypothetical protein
MVGTAGSLVRIARIAIGGLLIAGLAILHAVGAPAARSTSTLHASKRVWVIELGNEGCAQSFGDSAEDIFGVPHLGDAAESGVRSVGKDVFTIA